MRSLRGWQADRRRSAGRWFVALVAAAAVVGFLPSSTAEAQTAQEQPDTPDEASETAGQAADALEGMLHAEVPGLAELVTAEGRSVFLEPGQVDLTPFGHRTVVVMGTWQGDPFESRFAVVSIEAVENGDGHRLVDELITVEEEAQLVAQAESGRIGHRPSDDGAGSQDAIVANSHLTGTWGPVQDWPVIPVFASVLSNGTVLAYDSINDAPTEDSPDQSFTRATIWSPTTNNFTDITARTGSNLFCSGFAQLPNGDLFVAGGNLNQNLDGIVDTHVFSADSNTWSRTQNMAFARWYPSVTPLPSAELLITGGGPATPEVRTTGGAIRQLPGAAQNFWATREYPWLQTAPNGRVAFFGPSNQVGYIDTDGSGGWQPTDQRDGTYRSYGSYALYRPDRALVAGGGFESGSFTQRSAVVVDLNAGTSTFTGQMNQRRRQHNLTILADGTVLATGGLDSNASLVDVNNPVFDAELWDPDTGQWTTVAPEARSRQYHSTALLLPDGRVLSAGGGICGPCQEQGYIQKNGQVFTPPYLYNPDGSGQLADRPVIAQAPSAVGYGGTFSVDSPEAGAIDSVGLVRLGAVTHAQNMTQRYVPLGFTASGDRLSVDGPANANVAPPGHYMLFITNDQGVPSVSAIISVAEGVETGGTVGGVITDAAGDPVAGVNVDLFAEGRAQYLQSAVTDAQGRYTFDVDPGCYVVTAIAPDGTRFGTGQYLDLTGCVEAGEANTDLSAQLVEEGGGAAALTGSVGTSDGAPAAGVAIDLFASNPSGARLGYLATAITDSSGQYRFDLPADGCYVVTFVAPDGARFTNGSAWANESRCVADGETATGVDATIESAAAGEAIEGRVTSGGVGAGGIDLDLFTATATGERGTYLSSTTTASDGSYRFAVGGGCYVVTFVAPAGRSWAANGTPWLEGSGCTDTAGSIDAVLNP